MVKKYHFEFITVGVPEDVAYDGFGIATAGVDVELSVLREGGATLRWNVADQKHLERRRDGSQSFT